MTTTSVQKQLTHVMLHERARGLQVSHVAADGSGQMIHRGNTAHFNVNFDSSLGNNGGALADGVLATCENDYDRIQGFFPKLAKSPFLVETGTPITQADAAANFNFAVGDYNGDGKPDLYCLKHSNTGTGKLEVHILSGASNYQTFLVETGTPITQADAAANFNFAVGDYNGDGKPDLYCLKHSNTGTGKLEVHILSGASNYQTFLVETGTPITQADAAANFNFAVGDFNRDGVPDLYCLKRTNTGTQKLETHVLSGAAQYLGGLRFTINIVPGDNGASHSSCADTVLSCDAFNGTDANLVRMLVVSEADEVFMDSQGNGWDCGKSNGEGLSRLISAELYPGSQSGFVTGPTWLGGNRPDFVNTNDGTDRNFESIGCTTLFLNYLHYQLGFPFVNIVGAGGSTLAATYTRVTGILGGGFAPFATLLQQFFPLGQPVALTTDNPFPLNPFLVETGTPITQADAAANFNFAVGDYNGDGKPDLYCLKHSNTGTGKLEVHILSGASNYQTFLVETGTPITQADAAANFNFAVGDFNRDGVPDLYCLKRTNTGTSKLEVHILNGGAGY
jgi:hypothetical protein